MELNNIYSMDCLEGMKKGIRDKTVDVVVTSPPYNIGVGYNSYKDNLKKEEYLSWIAEIAKEIYRVLKDDGSFFFNVGGKPSNSLWPMEIVKRVCDDAEFQLQNTIHWVKSIAIPIEDVGDYPHMLQDISVGHFKPVNSKCYVNNCHEYIFHLTKYGDVEIDKMAMGVKYQDKSNIKRWKAAKEDLRDRGNTWFIPYETIRVSRPHPSTFPVKLPENCIKLHGLDKTELVLDPFMGIGTTAIACARLGVNYIGFEIDEGYCEIAKDIIRSEKRKHKELNGRGRRKNKLYRLVIENLSPEEMEPLFKELKNAGGFQSLIKKLQSQYSDKDKRIILENEDIERIARYSSKYGGGGWQERLSALMTRIKEIQKSLERL